MRRLLAVVAVLALGLIWVSSRRNDAPVVESRLCRSGDPLAGVYHPARLHVRSRCILATGVVRRVKFERYDGDVHITLRVESGSRRLLSAGNNAVHGDLVVEILPQDRDRVMVPTEGERVTVLGPWVDDTTHGWREIHPAWWISSGALRPATGLELARVRRLLLHGGPDGA
ncbi:MAG: hypothetical protein QOE36_2499 [Gaiellaceae bacterium]|nr:hypothetical protein [Gaiellaceae bacterium]